MKAAVTLLLMALGCTAAQAEQRPFTPAENDFSVAFAAVPTVLSEFPNGGANGGFRRYAAERSGEVFVLTIDRYPDGVRAPMPTKAIYQRLIWAHAQEIGAALVASRPALLSGLPCWEATYKTPAGRIETRRILMVGDSIYQLGDTRAQAAEGGGKAFFDSFRITASSLGNPRNLAADLGGPLT